MPRRSLSTKDRARIFAANDATCHLCGGKIGVGEAWEVEHVIAWELSRDDSDENLRPAHVKCHKVKTRQDMADIGRARRVHAKHIGAKAPSRRPLPGGRSSKWKIRVDGTIVPREGA